MIKWFDKFKIVTKLIGVFAFFTAFIGSVGAVGIYNMDKIKSNAVAMHDNNLKSVEEVNNMEQDYLTIRATLLKMTYKEKIDKNELDGLVKDFRDYSEKVNKSLVTYKEDFYTDEEKKILKK